MRKPFFKKSHGAWYCEIGRKQIRLGTDKEAAEQEYHRLMAGEQPVTTKTTAYALVNQYLEWTHQNRSAETFKWYKLRLKPFVVSIGLKMTVSQVKANHVTRWLAADYPDASNTFKNGCCRAIARCFNWAVKQGLIATNPIAGMERPAAEPREAYLTPEQWAKAIALVKPDDPFADFCWFLRETGARPQEARIIEAKHWDRENRRIVLERRNSKGKRQRRVIRLNDRATEIIARGVLKYPEGPVLRNVDGKPWKGYAINCRFARLRAKLGFPFFPYILRHSWCTDALLRGVDPLSVGLLMGHADASMVMRVYSHLTQQDEFLMSKLRQATGESA